MAAKDGVFAQLPRDRPIIVFDGVCVLCTANARFVLKHDEKERFRLAAMQNAAGAAIMRHAGLDPANPTSFILLDAQHEGGRIWMNSDAVLHMWSELGWPWRAGVVFRLIPRFLRDPIYRLIACNRYQWFGQREECWVPTPEQALRIL
ncbi:MAG: DCC1-like thiol-disulfide oxidoreductase family protein [Pseudomonadota bacterium]